MPTDVEIARSVPLRPIGEIAAQIGLGHDDLHLYGKHIAKVDLSVLEQPRKRPDPSKLILVTAITPTPAGEGKTTTSIGLAQAFSKLGESVCLALREPSLGPCMGVKGGACGGGWSQVGPIDRINLHFTGDFHAITSAHNLLAAMVDNHLYFDMEPKIDPRRVAWPRVLDMNDRALRDVIVGLGGSTQGVPRQSSFDITAASEVMALLCLSTGLDDLRRRIDRILVGYGPGGEPVLAKSIRATGAMMALLRDAVMPNLVQTLEGTPAFVHGGPFANIAHGCNSVIATRMAMHVADWAITEAGFGCDLGAEKFVDIKCQSAGLDPAAIVLVATVRALKLHGGVDVKALSRPDPDAVRRGVANLEKHIENVGHFGKPCVVAMNRFATDTDEELAVVREACDRAGARVALADHFAHGGAGATDLAHAVMEAASGPSRPLTPLYDWNDKVTDKIRAVATKMYGARDVVFTGDALRDLGRIKKLGYLDLPVCIAKTQSSLSDNPRLRGRPTDFDVTVRGVRINAGAGFLVVLTGDILRMPGLPREPRAYEIDLVDGGIVGVE